MKTGRIGVGSIVLSLLLPFAVRGQEPALPPGDNLPILRVEPGGATAAVTALAFSADGETLYTAGLDKVVRVWGFKDGKWELKTAFRVPIAPGNAGAINTIALSPDGTWLAIAGRGMTRLDANFREKAAIITDTALMDESLRLDVGLIYVANTSNPAGGKVLRGHQGEVRALAFAPASYKDKEKPPLLVSAANDYSRKESFGSLRLWDVKTGKVLASYNELPACSSLPGLAVWHTGVEPRQLRVAFAWSEKEKEANGRMRLWDAAPEPTELNRWKSDNFGVAAALLDVSPDGVARVVAGGYGPKEGQLRVWNFSSEGDPKPEVEPPVGFPEERGPLHFLPRSAVGVSAKGNGIRDHAAVILRPMPLVGSTTNREMELALLDMRSNQQRTVVRFELPRSDKINFPVLAASPRGRFLAVACYGDHSIAIFAIPDLFAGKTTPAAILGASGLALRHVAFTNKGEGLWLSDEEKPERMKGGMHFDFKNRKLKANGGAGLTTDSPETTGWTVKRDGTEVRMGNKIFPIQLYNPKATVTAVALLPQGPGNGILAVASTERDSSWSFIGLYHLDDGKPFRLLNGHAKEVLGLAFSATRPLLASVGDDRTICVWSLTDLDQTVGFVEGLLVRDREGKVVALSVLDGSPAAKAGLKSGDVLEAMGNPRGELSELKKALTLSQEIKKRKPGDRIAVRVAGQGIVVLPVVRAIEERKPLFSLVLLQRDKVIDWVGWSPDGPYDASGAEAEDRLYWHTNTGDAGAPVADAKIAQYRKQYYRDGILKHLVDTGRSDRALQKWDDEHKQPPPRPALRPQLDGIRLVGDDYLLREPKATLSVGLNNREYTLDDKHVLRWRAVRADNQKVLKDDAVATGVATWDGQRWSADLSSLSWRRGEYRVQADLFARPDSKEPIATERLTIRFQPLPPTLALRIDGKEQVATAKNPLLVMKEALTLQIKLGAPVGQEVEVAVKHDLNELVERLPVKLVQTGPGEVRAQEFTLKPGLNRLSVRAVNKDATAGHEEDEAVHAEVVVKYEPIKREDIPKFVDLKFEPAGEERFLDGKKVLVMNKSVVNFTGQIKSEHIIVEAQWGYVGEAWQDLPGPVRLKERTIDTAFTLKPGKVVGVQLRAKSENSEHAGVQVWLVYHPPLPVVTATLPADGPDLYDSKLRIAGTVKPATRDDTYELFLRVTSPKNDETDLPLKVDAAKQTWEESLTLERGQTALKVVVKNKWHEKTPVAGAGTSVRYRRPPTIVKVDKLPQGELVGTTVLDLVTLQVESLAGMELTELRLADRLVPFEKKQLKEVAGVVTWQLTAAKVSIREDDKEFVGGLDVPVVVKNDDGANRPAYKLRVEVKEKPKPPPQIVSVEVPSGTPTDKPEARIAFRIESESALTRVELQRGEEVLYRSDLRDVRQEGKVYVLAQEATVTLKPGLNSLKVVAVNAGDRTERGVVVTFNEQAVLIQLERIELRNNDDVVEQVLRPIVRPDGDIEFAKTPKPFVWLVGRVRWADPNAKQLDARDLQALVYVNNCLQFPVALDRRGADGEPNNVRRFIVPMTLSAAKNAIKVELKGQADVALTEKSAKKFDLVCGNPAKHQRLHLLVVGVDVKNGAVLKKRVLDMLGAPDKDRPVGPQGEFSALAFNRCILYHVLVGEVERGKVEAQLLEMNKEIDRLRKEGELKGVNDVILIYYQGADVRDPRGRRWLLTSRNLLWPKVDPEEWAIPCHDLPRVPGVQLLLLNVSGEADPKLKPGGDLGGDPNAGLLRYASLDRNEPKKDDPELLGLMEILLKKDGRLGILAELQSLTKKAVAQVVLDENMKGRLIREEGK